MIEAKIVPNLKCECGKQFQGFVSRGNGWMAPCPECSKPVSESSRAHDRTKFYGNRRFSGTESQSRCQGVHPDEVMEAKRMLPDHQHCIKDNGRIEFADRKEERSFARAWERLERQAETPPCP